MGEQVGAAAADEQDPPVAGVRPLEKRREGRLVRPGANRSSSTLACVDVGERQRQDVDVPRGIPRLDNHQVVVADRPGQLLDLWA